MARLCLRRAGNNARTSPSQIPASRHRRDGACKLKDNERLPAEGAVTLGEVGLSLEIKGEIELDE